MVGPEGVTGTPMLPLRWFFALSLALLAVRMYAARVVGFGDSEALYACYAMHRQAAYLDHPALVGVVARAIGGGAAPTPHAAHVVTSIAATLVPVLGVLAARAAGSTWPRAFLAGIVLALVPETAVGLFALTPDLLLAIGWLGALALAATGLAAPPSGTRACVSFVAAGLLAGAACAAKVSALLLVVALAATYANRHARAHARTLWPWAGLALGLLVFLPVVTYEAENGWPMLRHRLIETQAGAGPSLRNAGALVLGQAAYLSPLFAVAAVLLVRPLVRARKDDAIGALLFYAFALPLAVLGPLALVSRVAEPHWLAPPLLALPIAWARAQETSARRPISRRFGIGACATAFAFTAAAHAWVLVPGLTRVLPASFDPRFDIASELFGWADVVREVRTTLAEASAPLGEPADAVVVGPHWVVCAQLHAALGPRVKVGCLTPISDDFDTWLPRSEWRGAGTIVFVTDTRFDAQAGRLFPTRAITNERRVPIERGGRPSRYFTIQVLEKRALSKGP